MAAHAVIKAVLVDLSGAQEALKSCALLLWPSETNTTKECKQDLLERLKQLDFDIKEDEIFTSLTAARNLLEQKKFRPLLMVEKNALHDFTGLDTSDPNAVVIGLAPDQFNYPTMNKAFRLVLDGAPLIAIHKARYYKKKDGLYATDQKATVVGKPEQTFFLEALRGTNCGPEEAVMIGDVRLGVEAGSGEAGLQNLRVKRACFRLLQGLQGLGEAIFTLPEA
uniref:Haloacid dehalogenase-like hydrolase domain-containing protein 2 n=1 Tax=Naja naja TaxID=35670 RepID=A0A8C7E412_NAJNA